MYSSYNILVFFYRSFWLAKLKIILLLPQLKSPSAYQFALFVFLLLFLFGNIFLYLLYFKFYKCFSLECFPFNTIFSGVLIFLTYYFFLLGKPHFFSQKPLTSYQYLYQFLLSCYFFFTKNCSPCFLSYFLKFPLVFFFIFIIIYAKDLKIIMANESGDRACFFHDIYFFC